MKLVYVNELGPNFKGNYVYEFIFTNDLKNIWGDELKKVFFCQKMPIG